MNKELEALEALESIRGCLQTPYLEDIKNILTPYLDIIEIALRRNIELEEENKILKTIRDNFDLWLEPSYKATLQFLQCCTMTQSEYEKLIEYFGEPRDE